MHFRLTECAKNYFSQWSCARWFFGTNMLTGYIFHNQPPPPPFPTTTSVLPGAHHCRTKRHAHISPVSIFFDKISRTCSLKILSYVSSLQHYLARFVLLLHFDPKRSCPDYSSRTPLGGQRSYWGLLFLTEFLLEHSHS